MHRKRAHRFITSRDRGGRHRAGSRTHKSTSFSRSTLALRPMSLLLEICPHFLMYIFIQCVLHHGGARGSLFQLQRWRSSAKLSILSVLMHATTLSSPAVPSHGKIHQTLFAMTGKDTMHNLAARQRVTQPQRAGLDSSQYNKTSVSKRKKCKTVTLNDTRTILTPSTKYWVLTHASSPWTLSVAPAPRGSAPLETKRAVVSVVCRVTIAEQKYSRPAHNDMPTRASTHLTPSVCCSRCYMTSVSSRAAATTFVRVTPSLCGGYTHNHLRTSPSRRVAINPRGSPASDVHF